MGEKRNQVLISSTILVGILLLGSSLFFLDTTIQIPKQPVVIQGQLANTYHNLQQLEEASDVIALVKIEMIAQAKARDPEGMNYVFTDQPATVLRVFKGDAKTGEEIKILLLGGNYDNQVYKFEEDFQLSKNDIALLFLNNYSTGFSTAKYAVLGVWQGKYILGHNNRMMNNVVIPSLLETVNDRYGPLVSQALK